jgi:lysophospholipase L1-like esterase
LKFQNSGSGGTTAAHTNAIWVSTAGNPCGGWFVDHRVVSVWHGTNDITAWGTTTEYGDPGGTVANAAAVWAQYSALMTKYKGTFGKVIAWTSMDRGAYNVSNGDACMDEFNALVRANYLSCADYLVDVAQDLPQMRKLGVGQPGANTSGMPSAYFADTAHPNDAGYALIAALAEPVIRAAIGIGSGPPVTGLGGFDFSQAANSAWVAAI